MKHKLLVAGFGLFVVADIVLVAILVRHVKADSYHAVGQPIASTSTSSATSKPTAVVKPTGARSLVVAPSSLMRVTRGTCASNGRPYLELSTDLGKNFHEVGLPHLKEADSTILGSQPVIVKTILQVNVTSTSEIAVVASDANCVAHGYSTQDGGASWSELKSIKDWFVNASGDEVVSPAGPSQPGCSVTDLSLFSDRNAKVSCQDGTIRGTDDSGATWVTLGSLNGMKTAVFSGLRSGFAIAEDADCKSRTYVTDDAGLNWTAAGCAGEVKAESIAGTPARLLILARNDVKVSTDGGTTWTSPQ